MRPPTRQRPIRGSSFGAVVPEDFESWRPPAPARPERYPARRRRDDARRSGAGPLWGRIEDDEIEQVARQAADRRAARFEARQRFLGRLRGSAPRRPLAAEAWASVGRGLKVTAVALVVVLAAAMVLFAIPWLKVQRVEVEGSSVVPRQQLLAEAGGRWGQSILLLNTPAMSRELLAQPWVRSAAVTLRWPNTLVLAVTPLPPVLLYQRGSSEQLLAASGAVLGSASGIAPGSLPRLVDQRSGRAARAGSVVLPGRLTRALAALFRAFPSAYGVGLESCLITATGALELKSTAGWTADLGLALTSSQISSIGPKLEALRALGAELSLKSSGIKEIYLEDPAQVGVTY